MGPAKVVSLQLRLVRRHLVHALHRGDPERELADGEAVWHLGPQFSDKSFRIAHSQR